MIDPAEYRRLAAIMSRPIVTVGDAMMMAQNASAIASALTDAAELAERCATLETELEAARSDIAAKQRGYDDLHQMVSGSGDIWTKVDGLLRRMAADRNRSMAIESKAILDRERAERERDAARAEVEHWRKARDTALEGGDILRAEVERLRAGIREAIDGDSFEDLLESYEYLRDALLKLAGDK